MAGLLRSVGLALLLVLASSVGINPSLAASAASCSGTSVLVCGDGTAEPGAQTVTGWLITKGSPQAETLSAKRHGCGDCRWFVTTQCIRASGLSGPDGDHCAGIFVGCSADQLRFNLELETAAEPLHQVDTYCYAAPDGGVVTAATIAPDLRRYASQLTVATPTLETFPPDAVTLVNLPTYFAARAQSSDEATVGGQGYSLRLQVAASRYLWQFGDGSALATVDPGGPPPRGSVRHTYARMGSMPVGVTVQYEATYFVVTPFGEIGPEAVDGGPVESLPATVDLEVREAYAGLTG